jgi:hypothetical protein
VSPRRVVAPRRKRTRKAAAGGAQAALTEPMVDRLMWRAGVGPSEADRPRFKGMSLHRAVDRLLADPRGPAVGAPPRRRDGTPLRPYESTTSRPITTSAIAPITKAPIRVGLACLLMPAPLSARSVAPKPCGPPWRQTPSTL